MKANIEAVNALFLQDDFANRTLKITGEKVFRVQVGNLRHYRRGSNGRIYKSLTTFISQVMPRNKFLENWRSNLAAELGSSDKADEYVEATADYGSGLHISTADFCRNKGVNWSEFEYWAFDYLTAAGFKNGTLNAAFSELTKDFASMLQFLHDYQVEIIAVEIPVFLKEGIATLIDLVVEMNEKDYTDKTPPEKRKRIKAIINIKSGKKGFYTEHLMQLEGERRMFNQTFGKSVGYEIDNVFNLAPSDWKTEPTYKIVNQTKAINQGKIDKLFTLKLKEADLYGILGEPDKSYPVFTGATAYGDSPAKAIRLMNYKDFTKMKIEQQK